MLFRFDSDELDDLLQRHDVHVSVHDPLVESELMLHGSVSPWRGITRLATEYGWLAPDSISNHFAACLGGIVV